MAEGPEDSGEGAAVTGWWNRRQPQSAPSRPLPKPQDVAVGDIVLIGGEPYLATSSGMIPTTGMTTAGLTMTFTASGGAATFSGGDGGGAGGRFIKLTAEERADAKSPDVKPPEQVELSKTRQIDLSKPEEVATPATPKRQLDIE